MNAKKRRLMKNCDTKPAAKLSAGKSTVKVMVFSINAMSAKMPMIRLNTAPNVAPSNIPTATATVEPEETPAPAETVAPTETPAVTELPVQPSEVPVRFETVLLYDVNGSGNVDINDAQWLYAMLTAYESGEIAYEDILRYDLDGDGNLTQDDLACLMAALSDPLEVQRTCEIPLPPEEEPQPSEEPEAPALEESVSEEPVSEEPVWKGCYHETNRRMDIAEHHAPVPVLNARAGRG